MKEEHYSNREIDRLMQEIKEQLDRIEAQTTRTNGRVSSLEHWRAYSNGAIGIIILLLVPIIFMIIEKFI